MPSSLYDYRGELFAHQDAYLVQQNTLDTEGSIVAPWNMHWVFKPGSLVLGEVFLICERSTEIYGEINLVSLTKY